MIQRQRKQKQTIKPANENSHDITLKSGQVIPIRGVAIYDSFHTLAYEQVHIKVVIEPKCVALIIQGAHTNVVSFFDTTSELMDKHGATMPPAAREEINHLVDTPNPYHTNDK